MIERMTVRGFRSLKQVEDLRLAPFSVLFGPNSSGKSNFLDAVQVLSRLGTRRTLADALQPPVRGLPVEAFAFPPEGLPGLLAGESASFEIEADIRASRGEFRYRIAVSIEPRSGALRLEDEYLATLGGGGRLKREDPLIERVNGELRVRQLGRGPHRLRERVGANHSLLSDPTRIGAGFLGMEECRRELSSWHTYYLDPRVSMRRAAPPAEVQDIGVLGEDIAPFLHRLQEEEPGTFGAVERALRSLIPNVEHLGVDMDERRGTLDILVKQNGVDYSSRVISEGTLRVLALCAIAVNPWGGRVVAFEEPENGVHPRRLELIAELLTSLALERNRQLIVTTHSPLFCGAVLRKAQNAGEDIRIFTVRQSEGETRIRPLDSSGPLFRDSEVRQFLTDRGEDGVFEGLVLRGLLDE